MSTQRDDPTDDSESIDCRYYDRFVLDKTSKSGNVSPTERDHNSTHTTTSTSSRWYGRSVLSLSGMILLTVTKMLDAFTTGLGLLYVPGVYEANPLIAPIFHQVGTVTGLLIASFVLVIAITVITEASSILVSVRRQDGHLAPVVRVAGYGIPSVLFATISVYNVNILIAGIQSVATIPI